MQQSLLLGKLAVDATDNLGPVLNFLTRGRYFYHRHGITGSVRFDKGEGPAASVLNGGRSEYENRIAIG
jgi:hypothetical protein